MKILNWLKRKLGFPIMHRSETSKVRHLVMTWCIGKGCDVGFGGDKVVKENCDGIDFANPYTYTGKDKVDIPCTIGKENIPVADSSYDYLYSSHLIEDFEDTLLVLRDFVRVIKNNGILILVFPDQPKYEAHCRETKQPLNLHHVHSDMGLNYMLAEMELIKEVKFEILFTSNCEIDYNVILVAKVLK